MLVGYARISDEDEQILDLQLDALKLAGCKKIFQEKISTKRRKRPVLEQALTCLKPGDVFVVWRLCRLGRDLIPLLQIRADLTARGVSIRSISEAIDTHTSVGRLTYNIVAAVYEFERDTNSERTQAGMAAAKRRGKHVGRPRLSKRRKERIVRLSHEENLSPDQIARKMKIGRTTVWRTLANV